jgi:hypothetical protein
MKIKLKVTIRKGGRIESVPIKKLVKASSYRKKRWSYEDGWIILESY